MPPEADEDRDKAYLFDIVHGVRTRFGTCSAGSSPTCCLSWNESSKPEIGMPRGGGPHDSR